MGQTRCRSCSHGAHELVAERVMTANNDSSRHLSADVVEAKGETEVARDGVQRQKRKGAKNRR